MPYITPWLEGKATGIVQVYDPNTGFWVSLIDPSKMNFQAYDLDAGETTGRNLQGDLLRDRQAVKEKLVMEFPPMVAQDFTKMLSLIADQFFTCRYFSLKTGTVRDVTMYVGDREAEAYYNYDSHDPWNCTWTNIKFNFIER